MSTRATLARTFLAVVLSITAACSTSAGAVPKGSIYVEGIKEAQSNLRHRLNAAQDPVERSDILSKLAALEFASDSFARAVEYLSEIIAKDKSNSSALAAAYLHRGFALAAMLRHSEAIADFETAISHSAGLKLPRTELLALRHLNKELLTANSDLAESSLTKEAELAKQQNLQNDAGWAYLRLSDFLQKKGRIEDAQRAFNRAVIQFTRFFNQEEVSGSTDVVSTDLWDVIEAGPPRPPGAFWKSCSMPPRAVLVCIHGLGLHSGYYKQLGETLAKRGISTVAMDVRGFGQWAVVNERATINLDESAHDATQLVQALKALNPNVPIFLLGESMGGAIVLRAAQTADVAGVISSVPAADRYNSTSTKLRVVWHVLTSGNSDYDLSHDVVDRVFKDEALRDQWEKDSLARLQVAPTQLIKFDEFMKQNQHQAAKVTKPILVTQGNKDELVKEASTIKLFYALKSSDKDLLLIGSGQHLIFEAGQFSPVLIDGMLAWMDFVAKKN